MDKSTKVISLKEIESVLRENLPEDEYPKQIGEDYYQIDANLRGNGKALEKYYKTLKDNLEKADAL